MSENVTESQEGSPTTDEPTDDYDPATDTLEAAEHNCEELPNGLPCARCYIAGEADL